MQTSYGIICFRKNNNKYEFLMVKRRCTYAFSTFVNGRYTKANVKNLFNNMTVEEKALILYGSFDVLFYTCFLKRRTDLKKHKDIDQYEIKKKKYENSFSDSEIINFINGTSSVDFIWDFPKGKIGLNENNLEASIREFEEETGYNSNNYLLYKNADPIFIEFKEYISYRYILYFAYCPNIIPVTYKHYNETSETRWFDVNMAKLVLRPEFQKYISKIIKISKKLINEKECLNLSYSKSQKKLKLSPLSMKIPKNSQI